MFCFAAILYSTLACLPTKHKTRSQCWNSNSIIFTNCKKISVCYYYWHSSLFSVNFFHWTTYIHEACTNLTYLTSIFNIICILIDSNYVCLSVWLHAVVTFCSCLFLFRPNYIVSSCIFLCTVQVQTFNFFPSSWSTITLIHPCTDCATSKNSNWLTFANILGRDSSFLFPYMYIIHLLQKKKREAIFF